MTESVRSIRAGVFLYRSVRPKHTANSFAIHTWPVALLVQNRISANGEDGYLCVKLVHKTSNAKKKKEDGSVVCASPEYESSSGAKHPPNHLSPRRAGVITRGKCGSLPLFGPCLVSTRYRNGRLMEGFDVRAQIDFGMRLLSSNHGQERSRISLTMVGQRLSACGSTSTPDRGGVQ